MTILLAMTGGVSITSLSGRENSVAEAPAVAPPAATAEPPEPPPGPRGAGAFLP